MTKILLIITAICVYQIFKTVHSQEMNEKIKNAANNFGKKMLNIGYDKTCYKSIKEEYQKYRSEVKQIEPHKLMEEMRRDLTNMFNWKRIAVEKIAIEVKRLSALHEYEKDIKYSDYYNMKRIYDDRYTNKSSNNGDEEFKSLPLSRHPNFDDTEVNPVNSAVHVPINVYEKATDILNDIKLTEKLNQTFIDNFNNDSSLSYQFFGSSRGFIRIYPAAKWKTPSDPYVQSRREMPDLYDCRVQQWYIQTAASPKDIVILLDTSGSMTGLRRTIATNVVFSILDTLTEDDYVTVQTFSSVVEYVSQCINQMVQATKQNVAELKRSLENIRTADIANFTAAFISGFDILKNLQKERRGAQCNQAVMLITDGASENFEKVFLEHNPDKSIRVFTYVIGREVTQIQEVYWMACANRGYYAQVANLAEVREQVQQYIPVMSRPMVLKGERIFTYTPLYSQPNEILMTDWIWDERLKSLKTKFLLENAPEENDEELGDQPSMTTVNSFEDTGEYPSEDKFPMLSNIMKPYDYKMRKKFMDIEMELVKKLEKNKRVQLLTTIATPVFDDRNYINVTKKILIKNVMKDSDPEAIRIANLLGVAGIDIMIRDIEKTISAFKLGVNSYSFMTTNNGKIMFHPDFRPSFQGMLKPFYASVDFSEVEIANSTAQSRIIDDAIQQMRNDLINGISGSKKIPVKRHLDSLKRPITRLQHYVYGKIDKTPFSFGIVLPDRYGSYRFTGQTDLKDPNTKNVARYFNGTQWRIHPDWLYCESPHKVSGIVSNTSEDDLYWFLSNELEKNTFNWRVIHETPKRSNEFICNKEVLQSLVFDAKITANFQECSASVKNSFLDDKKIEILNAFVATRSGLTRFTDPFYSYENKNRSENERNSMARSIDEIFYRRAVDFYYVDSSAFVYSVPFDAPLHDDFYVTASQAIFTGDGKNFSPVAVVGLQYNYSSFHEAFFSSAKKHGLNCALETEDCFLLDNNAFIVAGEKYRQAGMFFGEVNDMLLQDMVRVGIFKKTHLYDYQAICIDTINTSNSAKLFSTPLIALKNIFAWLSSKILNAYFGILADGWDFVTGNADYVEDENDMSEKRFNKSKPRPCDKEFDLYEMSENERLFEKNEVLHFMQACSEKCSRNYYVHKIPHTNLILLALIKQCDCIGRRRNMEATPVVYTTQEICQSFRAETARKRPEFCFNTHPLEKEIHYCGNASQLTISIIVFVCAVLFVFFH